MTWKRTGPQSIRRGLHVITKTPHDASKERWTYTAWEACACWAQARRIGSAETAGEAQGLCETEIKTGPLPTKRTRPRPPQ